MRVLITGASGGFGRVLGESLVAKGFRVYGTMRKPEPEGEGAPFPMLAMEITDDASVEACIKEMVGREGGIDVVVNCANRMILGSVEETPANEVRELYDINMFGMLRVCQQVIPLMRAQGRGTIVNMSSLGGLFPVPTMSAYTSSKFALEAASEALHHELRDDPIDVVIMQPVAMSMDRPATGGHLFTAANVAPGSRTHRVVEMMAKDSAESGLTPAMVAEKVHAVITAKKKPLRVPMDRAVPLTWVRALAPQILVDKMISKLIPS